MSIPIFLSSSYFYFERFGVTDVQTILDDFEDQVLANSPVWTNPSAGVYVSPVDGYGRFFTVELTRVSATQLNVTFKDQNGTSLMARRLTLPAYGVAVRYFTGQFHFCINISNYTTSPQYAYGGILDLSPEAQNVHTRYCWCFASCNTSDTYHDGWFKYLYMIDNATSTLYRRVNQYSGPVYGYATPHIDAMGYWVMQPVMCYAQPSGSSGDHLYAGKMYQALLVPKMMGDAGATFTVPIDAGVTGNFKILDGKPDANVNNPLVIAMRVND